MTDTSMTQVAVAADADIDLDSFRHVIDGVYVGGRYAEHNDYHVDEDLIINCCMSNEYRINEQQTWFDDHGMTYRHVHDGAQQAFANAMDHRVFGFSLYARCRMGLNRSSFIAGAVLIAEGHDPQFVIDRIRQVRGPSALMNRSFEGFLLSGGFPVLKDEIVYYKGSIRSAWGPMRVTKVNVNGRLVLSRWNGVMRAGLIPTPVLLANVRPESVQRGRAARHGLACK